MRYKYASHSSKYVTVMVTLSSGSRVEHLFNKTKGIAHAYEHMAFKGTKDRDFRDITESVANYGGSTNAWTSEDCISFYIQASEDNIEDAVKDLADITLHSIFPEDEVKRELEVICQEVRMYDDEIGSLVHDALRSGVFSNSLKHSIIGTEESVRSITRKDLVEFKNDLCNKDRMLVSIASPTDRRDLVEKYFGEIDDVFVSPKSDTDVLYSESFSDKVIKDGQLQHSINISFGGNELFKSIKEKRHIYSVFNTLFGSGMASRLFMSVREELGLVYSIGSYLDYNLDGALYQISTQTEPENSDNVIAEVERQIDIICNDEPTEEELTRAKNKIKSKTYSKLDTSMGALSDLLNKECYGFKTGSGFIKDVESVTSSDIREIVKIIFGGSKYILIGASE